MKPIFIVFVFLILLPSLESHVPVSTPLNLEASNKIFTIENPIQSPKSSDPSSHSSTARFLDEKKATDTNKRRFSWGDKIKQSLADCIIGCILFIASFPTLWFNERRAVETDRMINEGQKHCEDLRADEILESKDGHLVYLSGECKNIDPLADQDLGMVVPNGLRLIRKVECFQWIESKSEKEERDIIGGGGNVYTEYSYSRQWSETHNDSANYNNSSKRNPALYEWPSRSDKFVSDSAYIGKFLLNKGQLEQLTSIDPVHLKENDLLSKNLEKFSFWRMTSL